MKPLRYNAETSLINLLKTMLHQFTPTPEDPILRTIQLYRNDPRPDKIDVGIGVFKDMLGQTPVMKAVRQAEQALFQEQTTKSYVGLAGDEQFNQSIAQLVFGSALDKDRTRAVQAPGGCGALSILTAMLAKVAHGSRVWVSDPTWGNHYPILLHEGFTVEAYPYFDRQSKTVKEAEFLDALGKMDSNDIVLLHGCCHNPTGAELSPAMWDQVAEICAARGIFPFVDLAYQGFGDSLEQDAYGVRALADKVETMVVASSCSKNFGIYRERVGCAMLVGENASVADIARGNLLSAARASYSMPPDHGAAVVSAILNDENLRVSWEEELDGMRDRILDLRQKVAGRLKEKSGTDTWDFIASHRGMFSTLVLDDQQIESLINDHAVYAVAGGRINIAGLVGDEQIDRFADALLAVTE